MSFSVIIPSRNAANLVPCVEAVRKCEPDARIIVVDDGLDLSGADLTSANHCWLCDMDPTLRIEGQKPFIFARNVNLGIQAALCRKIDMSIPSDPDPVYIHALTLGDQSVKGVVILNDDAILQTPGGFSLLAKTAEEHPEFGVIAATCNNVGNKNQWRMSIGFRDEPRMVCFVAVLIPRRTIETVGLLDERFTSYGCEDDDYSLRVRKAGLKIGIHDGCYVDHGSLTSSFRGPAGAGGNFLPNMKLFIEKWGHDNWGKGRENSPFKDLFPVEARA